MYLDFCGKMHSSESSIGRIQFFCCVKMLSECVITKLLSSQDNDFLKTLSCVIIKIAQFLESSAAHSKISI